jgi:hypothetical protein
MKNRYSVHAVGVLSLFLFSSCKKIIENALSHGGATAGQYYSYVIPQGQHYANGNNYQQVKYDQLSFAVKFDSTAIYHATNPENQEDINKLYGFSDNNANHQDYSARFGWNWARGALRLYAYTYNESVRDSKEITAINIGTEYFCSILVSGEKYFFTVNGTKVEMARHSTTAKGEGYKLYPYFGGDETAPHEIRVYIRE